MAQHLLKAIFCTLVLFASLLSCTAAQSPQSGSTAIAKELPRELSAPTNLKVLPKSFTGRQVQGVMEEWQTELGVRCDACHEWTRERDGAVSQLNFADDSKPMEDSARLMYLMTEEINSKFVAKVEGSGMPVTCGTCHRGRIAPEPFVVPAPQVSPFQYLQDSDGTVAETKRARER
jgi:Photosynthetic reaction centre cytochrome C subunit